MLMKNTNLQTPRIVITFIEKSGQRYYLRPTIRKARKLIRTSLETIFKSGGKVQLRVVYGKADDVTGKLQIFDNKAEVGRLKDFVSVFEAFIDKDLWIPKKTKSAKSNQIDGWITK